MFKTVLELQDLRALAIEKMTVLNEAAKTEKRKLSTEEDVEFRALKTEIDTLANEIVLTEARASQILKTEVLIPKPEIRKMKKFSLLKAIESRVNGTVMDAEQMSVLAAGREEMRKSGCAASGDIQIPLEYRAGIIATGAPTTGIEVVAEEKMQILAPLRDSLVAVQAGATFLTGLIGDVNIPAYGGTSAAWKGEVAAATDGAGAFSEIDLKPKRLTTFIDVSKQFLLQDSVGAEAMLMADIVKAISIKLEQTIFGKEAGSATQPEGLFLGVPAIAGAADWDNIVAMETAVDTANALCGNCKYITSPGAKGVLKTTLKAAAAGSGYLLGDNNEMNGYPVLVSNVVAKNLQIGADEFGIIFGNWSDLLIAQWGAIDLTIDTVTQAINANVRIVINAFFDAKIRRTESFKTASVK